MTGESAVLASLTPAVMAALAGVAIGALAATGVAIHVGQKRLRRVREAKRRARDAERLAEMGAMATGLAHEIKNPLSTIGLHAQLLSETAADLDVPEDDRAALQNRVRRLTAEADRLRDILSDFLEFAGEIKLDTAPTDLNAVVEELADFYMPQADSQGVRLRVDLAPGPLTADIDAPHVKQAVLNLLLNAVQAMATKNDPDAPKELILRTERRAADSDRGVAVHVIDTGPGIDDETLASIFKPYFTTKSGGSGLGLPTAKRIVDLHHGELLVHSEPGRGTDFTMVFPAS